MFDTKKEYTSTVFGWLLAVWTVSTVSLGGQETPQEARSSVDRWIAVERTLSEEAIAWKEKESLLNDLIDVATADVDRLKMDLQETRSKIGEVEAKRRSLLDQQETTRALRQNIEGALPSLEQRLARFVNSTPKPLREKLQALASRLPLNDQKPMTGIAERMQTVVSMIGEIHQFNSRVTVSEELRDLPNGESELVQTLFFGLGAAYYLASQGRDAGIGYAEEGRWIWQSDVKLTKTIEKAIAIAEGASTLPEITSLPVRMSKAAP